MTPFQYVNASAEAETTVHAISHNASTPLSQRIGGELIDSSAMTEMSSPGSHALMRLLSV